MNQRVTGQGSIQQRADRAELGQRQNRHQQLRAVLDKHRDHIALADALPAQIVRDTVGPLVDLRIGQRHLALQYRRAIGVAQSRLSTSSQGHSFGSDP